MNDICMKYQKRIKKYEEINLKQKKTADKISNLRLGLFLLSIVASIILWSIEFYFVFAACILCFVVGFIYLITLHNKILERVKYSSLLKEVNQVSLKRIQGQWGSFEDTGEEFIDIDHGFSYDLDVFGKGSVFQYINTTKTVMGRQKLKKVLTEIPESLDAIKQRQSAITELSAKLKMRQRLAAEGFVSKSVKETEPFVDWVYERMPFFQKKEVVIAFRVLPVLTVAGCYLGFVARFINIFIPVALLAFNLILLRINRKRRAEILNMAENYKDDLQVFYKILEVIEKNKFSSGYLSGLKGKLYNKEGLSASKQLKNLFKIADSISSRHAPFYILIDMLVLWDYQTLISLEAWKEKSGAYVKDWLDTIGEFEYLSSLSVLGHDNPDWVVPNIYNKTPEITAVNMGHPLILGNRVCNNLTINQTSRVLLITGSNMSGKSTLLRTVGINLVLAYAGTPVCADKFSCSLMEIYTCMRVSDNLEKSISSFYAELIRIKSIVEAVEGGKQLIFLLDEIFKGTNSLDRHTGARFLIKKLIKSTCIGLVSTHDLELESMEKETSEKVKNYHFTEYYKNNEICFDYKLKPGVCPTRNARYLMRLAGIEIDEL